MLCYGGREEGLSHSYIRTANILGDNFQPGEYVPYGYKISRMRYTTVT